MKNNNTTTTMVEENNNTPTVGDQFNFTMHGKKFHIDINSLEDKTDKSPHFKALANWKPSTNNEERYASLPSLFTKDQTIADGSIYYNINNDILGVSSSDYDYNV